GIWFNFYTDEKVFGGSEISLPVAESHIPVFVKEGSLIPMVPVFYSTDTYPSALEIHYYPKENAESHAIIYEDDGELFSAIEEEKYQLSNIAASNANHLLHLVIESNKGDYEGKFIQRELSFYIHDFK
ncbi:MAG: DUF5110 domain-containing protein, partial [Flavobacterium sp.]|nr:DUF5110 domain-containing protein [Flavobacterium sp.]